MLLDNEKILGNCYSFFSEQVLLNASAIAIQHPGSGCLTYSELACKVNLVAAYIARHHRRELSYIAILHDDPVFAVTIMMACLKLRVPYIPLNHQYPSDYINTIVEDAEPSLIITNKQFKKIFRESQAAILEVENFDAISVSDEVVESEFKASSEAYVIYTSGSTGRPKGVIIEHASIINLIHATRRLYDIKVGDKIPLLHSLAFDFSVWEIYSALFNGATLVIHENYGNCLIPSYVNLITKYAITVINLTPSAFYRLIEEMTDQTVGFDSLQLVILGGEPISLHKMKSWFSSDNATNTSVYNMYGITEGCIHVTIKKIDQSLDTRYGAPIGVPLEGVKLSILEQNNLSSAASEGELCIGGAAVAKGYLNSRQLTETKFFDKDGTRWFKTGDLVKRDGNDYFYLSRMDHVIKIRGFRLNLDEIEDCLLRFGGVKNVSVSTYSLSSNDCRLVAFLVANSSDINLEKLKEHVKQKLPNFMLPSEFVVLEQFPLTINGKVDINKMKFGIRNTVSLSSKNINSLDYSKKISRIWEGVLEKNQINLDESFFDSGGDSLLLIKLQYELQQCFGFRVELIDLIRYPTVKLFSSYLESRERANDKCR